MESKSRIILVMIGVAAFILALMVGACSPTFNITVNVEPTPTPGAPIAGSADITDTPALSYMHSATQTESIGKSLVTTYQDASTYTQGVKDALGIPFTLYEKQDLTFGSVVVTLDEDGFLVVAGSVINQGKSVDWVQVDFTARDKSGNTIKGISTTLTHVPLGKGMEEQFYPIRTELLPEDIARYELSIS